MLIIIGFRVDGSQNERKRKRSESDQPLEELYESNVSKIMKENGEKSVRMLLPIKTRNGVIEKRVIEEDEIANEVENENKIDDNHEEDKKDNHEGNSDIEMDMETQVR